MEQPEKRLLPGIIYPEEIKELVKTDPARLVACHCLSITMIPSASIAR
jgi:hypothetical protein